LNFFQSRFDNPDSTILPPFLPLRPSYGLAHAFGRTPLVNRSIHRHQRKGVVMEKRIRLGVLCVLAVLYGISPGLATADAHIPRTMGYQGILTDAGGGTVPDGNYRITFNLYESASGADAIWTEEQSVAVTHGVFNTVLGGANPLDLPFSRQYWLGVTVGEGAEMTPRIQLTSSAYSLRAANADSLNGLSAGITPAPNRIIPLGPDGKFPSSVFPSGRPLRGTAEGDITAVYAGTGLAGGGESGDVTLAVHVPLALSGVTGTVDAVIAGINTGDGRGVYGESAGGTGVRGKSGSANGIYGSSLGGNGVRGESSSSDGVCGQSGTGAGVRGLSSSGHAGYFVGRGYFSGNVGIGLTNPQRLLHLSNPNNVSIVLEDSGAAADQRKKFINTDDGFLRFGKFSDSWGFIPQMTISNDGMVGIETANPAEKLHVAGTIYSSAGGFKFPDGTVQTTSAIPGGGDISAVHAGSGLSGGGESGDVTLSVQIPLALSGSVPGSANALFSAVNSSDGRGVYGESAGGSGVRGKSGSANGVYGTSNSGAGVTGESDNSDGVQGKSRDANGILGTSSDKGNGVYGENSKYNSYGVLGSSSYGAGGKHVNSGNAGYLGTSEYGVYGWNQTGTAILGVCGSDGYGLRGVSGTGYGVFGESSAGIGVGGNSSSGFAGYFEGKGYFSGNLGIGTATPSANLNVVGTAAIGSSNNVVTGTYAIALGEGCGAAAAVSIAIGVGAQTSAAHAVSIGTGAHSDNLGAISIGYETASSGFYSMALGSHINAAGNRSFGIGLDDTPRNIYASNVMAIMGGNVGIGTTSPGNILTIAQGSATDPVADAWTVYSSRRLKTRIEPLERSIEKVLKLQGVSFEWKANGKQDIGLIAEDVGRVIPEVVTYEANGIDATSVDYSRLVSVLIEAVKTQQNEIDALKKRLTVLESR
jgi:hypothetical protein